ncbi:hypothetical protein MTO96_031691 [Rhipicephalus appendiculatus]
MLLALVDEPDFLSPGRLADGWSLEISVELLAMAPTRTRPLLRHAPSALMMAGRFFLGGMCGSTHYLENRGGGIS